MRWFGRRHPLYRKVEDAIGYRFKDHTLLETALTHRSHAHEQGEPARTSYERLEFLGDAVLGFVVAEWLYHDDRSADEGTLSRRRQAVVNTSTLASAARRIGLGEVVRLGRGEERTGGRGKRSLLADAFEAVLGAVYLDGGVRRARRFVVGQLGERMRRASATRETMEDHKTRLQETAQARLQHTPRYRIVATEGPPHARLFRAEVVVDGRVLGAGSGSNRKRAEQMAAKAALADLESSELDSSENEA